MVANSGIGYSCILIGDMKQFGSYMVKDDAYNGVKVGGRE